MVMKSVYKILDSININNSQVLVMDRKRDFNDWGSSVIIVDGVKYPFTRTHTDNWIIIKSNDNLVGKDAVFSE